MQMAMAVGECTGEDADLLRRAMGSKRGVERIESLREKLYAGMATNGLVGRGRRRHLRARSRRSRTSASPSRTRCRSRCSSTRARGSSCTTRRRSSRGCCAPSRWGSTRPRRSSAMPAATASRCAGPTCMRSGVEAVLEPVGAADRDRGLRSMSLPNASARRPAWTPAPTASSRRSGTSTCTRPTSPPPTAATAASRCASGSPRSRASARRSPSASSPSASAAAPTATCATSCAAPGSPPAQLEALATAGAFECLGLTRREAIWLAGSAAAGPRRVPPRLARRRCSRRCSPTRRATRCSPPTCGRPASPPTTTR